MEGPSGDPLRSLLRIAQPERRFGGTSAAYDAMNRNKRVVALDLRARSGRAALAALLDTADVLVRAFQSRDFSHGVRLFLFSASCRFGGSRIVSGIC